MDRRSSSNHADPTAAALSRGRPVSGQEAALADKALEKFMEANTLTNILGHYRNICDLLHLKPNVLPLFYPKLKANLSTWKPKALWKKLDLRVNSKCYGKARLCTNTRVLIIGGGPCGLRTAIEAQLLGAKVVVVEKRDRMSRNNVLHLWPFVIDDLRLLAAKKLYGKFCAGSIDHISIMQLQFILLKVALLFGVEVHTEISFERLLEPSLEEKIGWRAEFKPTDHPVSQYEFDVVIGADGKRNTLQGFKRKEFRGKLAIAITANFINRKTEAEACVEEISGVAFIFNQKFFKDLFAETSIDLENIVYYKDDTHYFVMTAKKPSLISKGVIKQDLPDTAKLLAPENVDREALMNYARDAAEFSTNYQMLDLEFAVNHYGQPDVAMFDFTSMYASENASRVIERHGHKLLCMLVGDSLLEPFWPTGSGCARGFLSSLDAAWAIRSYGSGMCSPLEVIAERESIYRLLAQTTPENLNKDYKAYTLDPSTRYPNLNKNLLLAQQVISLYDTDDPKSIEMQMSTAMVQSTNPHEMPKKRRKREIQVDPETLLNWFREQTKEYANIQIDEINNTFRDGTVLCAIVNRYNPDLLDYSAINPEEALKNNQYVFDILEKELGIPATLNCQELVKAEVPNYVLIQYLSNIYDLFRGTIPHIKYPKLKPIKSIHQTIIQAVPEKVDDSVKTPETVIAQASNACMAVSQESNPKLSNNISAEVANTNSEDNSKSLVYNISPIEDEEAGLKYENKKFDRISKSQYVMESKLLQEKIDAAIRLSGRRKRRKYTRRRVLQKQDVGVGSDDVNADNEAPSIKTNDTCCCCELNKRNLRAAPESKTFNDCDVDVFLKGDVTYKVSYDRRTGSLNIQYPIEESLGRAAEIKPKAVRTRHNFHGLDKISSFANMSNLEQNHVAQAEHAFDRIVNWISVSDFNMRSGTETPKSSLHLDEMLTDITSVTRRKPYANDQKNVTVEKHNETVEFKSDGTQQIRSNLEEHKKQERKEKQLARQKQQQQVQEEKSASAESLNKFIEELRNPERMAARFSRLAHCKPNKMYEKRIRSRSEPPGVFAVIVENEENEVELLKQDILPPCTANLMSHYQHRQSRHKRQTTDAMATVGAKMNTKTKKRRTAERAVPVTNLEERMKRLEEIEQNRNDRQSKRKQQRRMQTNRFIKSMQMLQSNCKPDHSEPFEDYSIFLYRQTAPNFEDRVRDLEKKFTYIPDRENRAPPVQTKGERDEDFQARIRGLEDKWRENAVTEKKPRDLLRAIGKIDNSDWNIKEIEKKINENKLGKNVNKDKEKVPKWSREQFLARQTKMEKQHLERQDSTGGKFAEIDKNLKILNQRLMEGSVRDVNQQRVAVLTEKLLPKTEEAKTAPKPTTKPPVVLPVQGKAEICHLCEKRVYLMEQLLAEGKVFHRSCFRCQYCHALLRLGSYLYDRDGKYGYRFYCTQHFGMSGELKSNKVARKPSVKLKDGGKSPEKKFLSGVAGLDLLDRVQTPERIEFSNLSTGNASSDQEESLSQMDEDEWTDKNFGASTAEVGSSDDDSSSLSDTESDDEDAYEEALEEPPTKEGTLRWAERYNRRYMRKHDDSDSEDYSSTDHSSYYENSSGEDDSDTATEGEEEILARELRKQEVRVEPPVVHTDTGTDTEIATDDTSDSSGGVQNSATEISTDSEFAHDDPTPTRELPSSVADDRFVTKMRGKYHQHAPQKVQVKSTQPLQKANKPTSRKDIELKFTPLVLASPQILKKPPAQPLLRNEGFALNRTQSTGGIATKVSLELKKKYLLGESSTSNAIQKSGSASTLDSKFKSFHSTISDCQKLLKSVENARAGSIQRTSPLSPLFPVLKDPMKQAIEAKKLDEETPCAVVNETEGRPRSPVHETSIIVPQIDWSQHKPKKVELSMSDSSGSSSSSSSDPSSSESEANNDLQKSPSVKAIPKVDVQNADHLPMDSLNYEVNYTKLDSQTSSINEPPKSISSEKKALNQPKLLPSLDDKLLNQVHQILHGKIEEQPKTADKKSGQSTPSNNDDPATGAVLTETELSDWARDEAASDDFEDVEYELNPDLIEDPKREKKLNNKKVVISKAAFSEFEDLKHVCGKDSKVELMECVNNILNPHLDNIEFMDTGTESSDDGIVEAKNNGYVQFHDEDDIAEDSLSPVINVVEAMSPRIKAAFDEDLDDLSTSLKNTGYCIIDTGKNQYGGEVIDLKPIDLEKLKDKRNNFENEEDSLLVVETGTTTEENTCSDSTVKNLTQLKTDVEKEVKVETVENNNSLNKKRLEDKLAQVKKDMKKLSEQRKADQIEEQNMKNSVEFVQHCQRLQSKVDFGNAKDSIDIRKSRRQSKTGSPPKPDLIQEEKESTPVARSKREQIEMERDQNKRLVEEMVMNKMRAENKSLERKRRNRNSFSPSPSRPFELAKSATGDVNGKYAAPPDVLLSTLQKSETVSTLAELNSMGVSEPKPVPRSKYASRPMSVHSALVPVKLPETPLTNPEAFSLPDIQKALSGGGGGGVGGGNEFKTPKAPPRVKNEEAKRTVEKLKQDARARARLLSDEDLGLSPEDKLARLRQKLNRRGKENDADAHVQESIESLVISTERRNSLLYSNDTLSKKKNGGSFRRSKSGDDSLNSRERTKSVSEMNKSQLNGDGSGSKTRSAKDVSSKCFKSDPNLLNTDAKKKKKGKDPERRRSLTKLLSSFFNKKDSMTVTSSANNHKGFLSRISPKTKDKSKSCVDLLQYGSTVIKEEPVRRSSFTETRKITTRNSSPPPIPPLPLNYTGSKSNVDDSSDGESEWKHGNRGSCDTIDHSSKLDGGSICSLSGRRSSGRSARKVARQSQVKRHRTAQEIQRKLEETEVKIRELEQQGVLIEKALGGELDSAVRASREEADLLKNWFDLMRDTTELRRYERELVVRAEELQLEDRHARLQYELKERLDDEGKKTREDIETEGSILKEMMDIVDQRNRLIQTLEEDRLRYCEEDRNFEEQMLAKGINLAPVVSKPPPDK